MLIILSGPSGVGKGTVREELFKDDFEDFSNKIELKYFENRNALDIKEKISTIETFDKYFKTLFIRSKENFVKREK